MDFPIKNDDFPCYVSLPEGTLFLSKIVDAIGCKVTLLQLTTGLKIMKIRDVTRYDHHIWGYHFYVFPEDWQTQIKPTRK